MMKMNKWTMALAAAGVVSLSSVAQAQEAVAGADGGSAGTLSGYVSTSYTMVKDGIAPAGYWTAGADTDRYALDVVDLRWHKDQAAQPWGAGYTFEIWAGPAAAAIGTGQTAAGTVEIMEANIDLNVGSVEGLNLKVGYFTTIVGAETYNYNANAFHSRSFGFALEPTHHTGILGSYTVSESLEIQFGVANDSTTAVINSGDDNDPLTAGDSDSTLFMGSLKYKLPDSLGPFGGASLYYAVINGAGADTNEQDNHYVSLENLALGIEGLTYKLAIDWTDKDVGADSTIIGHYLSYAVNNKVTLNARIEMGNVNQGDGEGTTFGANQNLDGLESYTIGVDYKLWENVTSRLEWRVDDADNIATDQETLGVNIIYSF